MDVQILKAFQACVGNDETRENIYGKVYHDEVGMVATTGHVLAVAWGQGAKDNIVRSVLSMAPCEGVEFPDWRKVTGELYQSANVSGLVLTPAQTTALLTFARKWGRTSEAPVLVDFSTSSIQCAKGGWAVNVDSAGDALTGQVRINAALTLSVLRHIKNKSLTVRFRPVDIDFPMLRIDVLDGDVCVLSVWQAPYRV